MRNVCFVCKRGNRISRKRQTSKEMKSKTRPSTWHPIEMNQSSHSLDPCVNIYPTIATITTCMTTTTSSETTSSTIITESWMIHRHFTKCLEIKLTFFLEFGSTIKRARTKPCIRSIVIIFPFPIKHLPILLTTFFGFTRDVVKEALLLLFLDVSIS